jgi:hypothetical protein
VLQQINSEALQQSPDIPCSNSVYLTGQKKKGDTLPEIVMKIRLKDNSEYLTFLPPPPLPSPRLFFPNIVYFPIIFGYTISLGISLSHLIPMLSLHRFVRHTQAQNEVSARIQFLLISCSFNFH